MIVCFIAKKKQKCILLGSWYVREERFSTKTKGRGWGEAGSSRRIVIAINKTGNRINDGVKMNQIFLTPEKETITNQ